VKLLIVGREGQVARALARTANAQGVEAIAIGRPELDLERMQTIAPLIAAAGADVVINAAAYTAVDQAESEPALAFAVNAAGAEAVARGAAQAGAAIVHLSTDYVFSGDKPAPYVEGDRTGPTSVYGASKLEGEQRVRAANPGAVIVRTAWVYDAAGRNFVRTMLRLARSREAISVVEDQWGCPTYADDLAGALVAIARRGANRSGIYHCAGAGQTNWSAFAQEIFRLSRERGGPSAKVIPIPSRDYAMPAPRPANSRLDCSRIAADYDVKMRAWAEALSDCIDAIAAGGWRLE
jgi:dTDP-4-dehydrorhamnose reductase